MLKQQRALITSRFKNSLAKLPAWVLPSSGWLLILLLCGGVFWMRWHQPFLLLLALMQKIGAVLGCAAVGYGVATLELGFSGMGTLMLSESAPVEMMPAAALRGATLLESMAVAGWCWLLWLPRLRILGLLILGGFPWLFWPMYMGPTTMPELNLAMYLAQGTSVLALVLIWLHVQKPRLTQFVLRFLMVMFHLAWVLHLYQQRGIPNLAASLYGGTSGGWLLQLGALALGVWVMLILLGRLLKRYEASGLIPHDA